MSIDIIARAMAASAEGGEGTTYTAGDNIQISADNVISATDTTYEAGDNITIEGSVISATGGGTEYTAGEGIDIIDDVISISGILPAFEVEDGDITVSDEYGNHTYIYSHDIELSDGEESIELSNRAIRYTGYHDNEITVNFEVEAITTEFNIDGETKNIRLDANDFEDGDYIIGSSLIETALNAKQDTLTAGTNITIEDNVISASGGSSLNPITPSRVEEIYEMV